MARIVIAAVVVAALAGGAAIYWATRERPAPEGAATMAAVSPGAPVAAVVAPKTSGAAAPAKAATISVAVPVAAGTAADGLQAIAQEVFQHLAEGQTAERCQAIQDGIRVLLVQRAREDLRSWAVERALDCRFSFDIEGARRFITPLIDADPGNFSLVASHAFMLAMTDPAAAIDVLERALEFGEDAHALDSLAFAHLSAADPRPGRAQVGDRQGHLRAAEAAAERAVELREPRPDSWTLERLAEAKLELGKINEAIAVADRALRSADATEDVPYSALLYQVGRIYFRAGQRETGIAYLDQAVQFAPPDDQANMRNSRDAVIAGRD